MRFRMEDLNLLLDTFFEELKSFARQIGRGTIVVVEHADQHVDEIDVDANASTLLPAVLRIVSFNGLACRRVANLTLLPPGRTIRLTLPQARAFRHPGSNEQDG